MKLLFISSEMPPAISGVGDYTFYLAKAFRENGVDARVLTSRGAAPSHDWIYPAVERWRTADVMASISKLDFSPDWICFQYVPQMYGRAGICWDISALTEACRKKGWKVAVTFHEIATPWEGSLRKRLLSAIMRLQALHLLKSCNLSFVTCAHYAKVLGRLNGHVPHAIVPVGSNVPVFRVPQMESNETVFGIFGRMAEERNFLTAIQVLERFRQGGKRAILVLAGDVQSANPKGYAKFLERAQETGLESLVKVTGKRTPEQLSECLQRIDVFLLPILQGVSTRNTTLMAALAHNLPVITYAAKPGYFEGYEIPCGAQVPRGDEEAFIQAALDWAEKKKMGQEKGRKNENYFEQCFSWKKIQGMYAEAFLKMQNGGC